MLAWLRVACTARGGVGDFAGIPAMIHTCALLLSPVKISDYVAAKVASNLPGRGRQGPAAGIAMTAHELDPSMVAAVQQLAENVGGAGGRGAREPKGVMVEA